MDRDPDFLAYEDGDHMAVAVRDVKPGSALVGYRDGTDSVHVWEPVPLGRKLALADMAKGNDLIECSGIASQDITRPGDELIDIVVRTISRRLTRAELRGYREFTPAKHYRSA